MLRVNGACIGSIGVAAALAVWAGSASAPTAHAGQIAATPAQDNAAPTFNAIPGVRETTNRLLAQLAPTTTPADLATLDVNILTTIDALGLTALRLAPDADAETVAAQLLDLGLAEAVGMDYLVHPIRSDANDPLVDEQWHLDRIGAPASWAFSVGSPDVTIAFIDTGVDLDHIELEPLLVPGYNAASQQAQAAGGNVADITGHGTATAGAAAAIGNNAYGGSGVGWNFGVMPIRATNTAGGAAFISDILNGGSWAVSNGADVISVSYAGVEQAFVEGFGAFARSNNVLVVWGIDDAAQPRNFDHPNVLVVSGTTPNDQLASFSSFGPGVDVAAPATSLNLPHSNGGYRIVAGNSYATPIVAAAAGMAWAINPALSASEIEQIILDTAEDLGEPGDDQSFGAGILRVDEVAAAALAASGQPADFQPAVGPVNRLADGIAAGYYTIDPATDAIPNFASLSAYHTEVLAELDLDSSGGVFGGSGAATNVGAVFAGFFDAPADRLYTFALEAESDARMRVAGAVVADTEAGIDSGMIGLAQGLHPVVIEHYAADGEEASIRATVASPAAAAAVLSNANFKFVRATSDFNGDGVVDLVDFSLFIGAWSLGDPDADVDEDGVVTLSDVAVFLSAWSFGL
ncbi:MAG: S8 family serine peptidase [Planctomycetota bacterium]